MMTSILRVRVRGWEAAGVSMVRRHLGWHPSPPKERVRREKVYQSTKHQVEASWIADGVSEEGQLYVARTNRPHQVP